MPQSRENGLKSARVEEHSLKQIRKTFLNKKLKLQQKMQIHKTFMQTFKLLKNKITCFLY